MATGIPTAQLAERIQRLLDDRQEHADAISRIDETLAGVGAALGSTISTSGHQNGSKTSGKAASVKAPVAKKQRRGRGGFAMSAEESILSFVKQQKNPTTAEINAYFRTEGRKSTADNALGKLVGEGKLKRVALGEGIRGSYYSIA